MASNPYWKLIDTANLGRNTFIQVSFRASFIWKGYGMRLCNENIKSENYGELRFESKLRGEISGEEQSHTIQWLLREVTVIFCYGLTFVDEIGEETAIGINCSAIVGCNVKITAQSLPVGLVNVTPSHKQQSMYYSKKMVLMEFWTPPLGFQEIRKQIPT
nr:hypothetical protein Iba_chr12eCG10830 [Ipomoea batatas]